MMKILEVSFKTFSFKDNVIILLCNKKVKRKKNPLDPSF
jgi:hypothetical protein